MLDDHLRITRLVRFPPPAGTELRTRGRLVPTVGGPQMILTLRVLHVAVAAAWFGHKLLIPSDLRRSLSDLDQATSLLPRLQLAERLGIGTGLGTLGTGLLLTFMIGPGVVAWPIYFGLGLVLIAIAVGAVVARPASIELREAIEGGTLERARKAGQRLSAVLTAEGLLWAGALVTMLI